MMFGDSVLFGGEVVLVVIGGELDEVRQVSGRSAAVGVPYGLIPQKLHGVAVPGDSPSDVNLPGDWWAVNTNQML